MTKTFDMQFIRYINLFGKVTRVNPKHCFTYNNTLVFVVSRELVQQAIGRDNSNLKKLSEILGKRIRVLAEPNGLEDIEQFFTVLVSPIKFEKLEVIDRPESGKELVINAGGRESKAMLIGRDRAREKEMKEILEQYFEIKSFKIM
jgi:NusA-like KH domain protein